MNYNVILNFIFPKTLIPISLPNSSMNFPNEFKLSENINSRNYKIVKVFDEIKIEYNASSCLEFLIQPYLWWVVGVIKLNKNLNQKYCEIQMTNWFKNSVAIIYLSLIILIIAALTTDPMSVWFPLLILAIIILILKLAASLLVKYVAKMLIYDLDCLLIKCTEHFNNDEIK